MSLESALYYDFDSLPSKPITRESSEGLWRVGACRRIVRSGRSRLGRRSAFCGIPVRARVRLSLARHFVHALTQSFNFRVRAGDCGFEPLSARLHEIKLRLRSVLFVFERTLARVARLFGTSRAVGRNTALYVLRLKVKVHLLHMRLQVRLFRLNIAQLHTQALGALFCARKTL